MCVLFKWTQTGEGRFRTSLRRSQGYYERLCAYACVSVCIQASVEGFAIVKGVEGRHEYPQSASWQSRVFVQPSFSYCLLSLQINMARDEAYNKQIAPFIVPDKLRGKPRSLFP